MLIQNTNKHRTQKQVFLVIFFYTKQLIERLFFSLKIFTLKKNPSIIPVVVVRYLIGRGPPWPHLMGCTTCKRPFYPAGSPSLRPHSTSYGDFRLSKLTIRVV